MPFAAKVDDVAAAELRGAAHILARHLPEGFARRHVLSVIGQHLEGGGDSVRDCARCQRPFTYDRSFFISRGLSEPRACFSCRVLRSR